MTSRIAFLLLACTASVYAQVNAPIGIVRGDLTQWEGTNLKGVMSLRAADARILTCTFDGKTYFERDNQRISPPAMAAGDRVEIVADRHPGSDACYARTVHVLDTTVVRRPPGSRPRPVREVPDPTERFAPRGNLTIAGLVMRVDPNTIVIKTRTAGEQTILLRSDTQYTGEGLRVAPDSLLLRTQVFVRAGKNIDGDVEAYSVMWGDILHPRGAGR